MNSSHILGDIEVNGTVNGLYPKVLADNVMLKSMDQDVLGVNQFTGKDNILSYSGLNF